MRPFLKLRTFYSQVPFTRSNSYNGKIHNHLTKVEALLSGLEANGILPAKTIIMNAGLGDADMSPLDRFDCENWNNFIRLGKEKALGRTATGEIEWRRMPFDWPIWILFSSGTTGKLVVSRVILSLDSD